MKKLLSVLFSVLYVSHSALGQDVTVQVGQESVSLPFTMRALRSEPSVRWRREGSTVHLRDDQGDDLRDQSSVFRGRTSMKQDALQTGDLTLVLSKPTLTDSGTYTCVVKEDITEVGRKTVTLTVTGTHLAVSAGTDSVSLSFSMRPLDSLSVPSVLWTREGSPPETVHLRVKDGDDLSGQSPVFKDRTQMNSDALQTGDLTLVLSKPTLTDSGTYSCVVREGSTEMGRTSVELTVTAHQVPWGAIVGGVVGVLAAAAVAAAAGVILSKQEQHRQKRTEVFHSAMGLDVTVGAEFVSLPFTMRALGSDSSVLWRRGGSTVYSRDDQGHDVVPQSSVFRGRTRMKQDALQTGDLRLVLSKPTLTDSGTYSCVVREDRTEVGHTFVKLTVTGTHLAVSPGTDSVSLSFSMRPLDSLSVPSVLWTREGSPPETVHLRVKDGDDLSGQSPVFKDRTQMNSDALQTGDLTLVLSKPTLTDSGTYSCVVKNGSTEMGRTSVELTVTAAPASVGLIPAA